MFHLFFLQMDTTKVVQKVEGFKSIGNTIMQGGWLMLPLALLFVVALFFFFERFILLQKFGKIEENFMNIIRDNVVSGNITLIKDYSVLVNL